MTAMYMHGSVWYGTDYGQCHQATSYKHHVPGTEDIRSLARGE